MKSLFEIKKTEDFTCLEQLERSVFANPQEMKLCRSPSWQANQCENWLAMNRQDQSAIGLASLSKTLEQEQAHLGWKIERLAVSAPHRNQGAGLALFQSLMHHHITQHTGQGIWVETAWQAKGFFLKMGFVYLGQPKYLGPGCWTIAMGRPAAG